MNTRIGMLAALVLAALLGWAAQEPEDGPAKGKAKVAQSEAPPSPPPAPQVLRLVRPGMYLITGRGSNSVARTTSEGVILVDSKLPNPGEYERLVELIRGVSPQPVKFVFNTSAEPTSAGNNPRFQASGAQIAAPGASLVVGGVPARSVELGSRRMVHFPADQVLCVGDLPAGDPGWAAALELEWTLAIPSSGEPVYRSVVEAQSRSK
jgi:hypothetical protein